MSSRPVRLSDEEVARRLAELPGWRREGDRLRRRFEHGSFVEAFGWMASVALVAERMNHHPDWKNVYGTVEVELFTHDVGGITELDVELASAMSRLASG